MAALVHREDVLSVLAGAVAFVLVTVGVTAALDPAIAFSILVGLPVGFTAGIAAVPLTYTWLAYRRERRDGGATARTTRRFRTAVVGAAAVVCVVLVGAVTFALDTSSTGLVLLLYGTPAGFVGASVVTYVAFGTGDDAGPRSPTEALAAVAIALLVTGVGTAALTGSIWLYLAVMVAVALALGAAALAYRFVGQRRRSRTVA